MRIHVKTILTIFLCFTSYTQANQLETKTPWAILVCMHAPQMTEQALHAVTQLAQATIQAPDNLTVCVEWVSSATTSWRFVIHNGAIYPHGGVTTSGSQEDMFVRAGVWWFGQHQTKNKMLIFWGNNVDSGIDVAACCSVSKKLVDDVCRGTALDAIIFDTCSAGTLETIADISRVCRYCIASQDVAMLGGHQYQVLGNVLSQNCSVLGQLKLYIDACYVLYKNSAYYTYSLYESARAILCKRDIENVWDALEACREYDARKIDECVEKARECCQRSFLQPDHVDMISFLDCLCEELEPLTQEHMSYMFAQAAVRVAREGVRDMVLHHVMCSDFLDMSGVAVGLKI